VIAGPDEARATAWRLALPAARRDSLRDYRVAAWLDDPACPVDGEVRGRLEAAVESLRRAGVRVDDRARPVEDLAQVHRNYEKLLWPIIGMGLPEEQIASFARWAESADAADESPPLNFARSATIRHRDWLRVSEWRARYRAQWAEFFRRFDVLLCPIAPTAAIPHDHSEPPYERRLIVDGKPRPYWDLLVWAGLVTSAFLPATVAPVGRTSGGLPVGVQIVGPYLEDRTPIDFARRLADVAGGFEPPPGY
jgi:amidase